MINVKGDKVMTNTKKIVNKGYTLEVVSWENDGDNYRTKHLTVPTKEEALAVKHLCEVLFDCTDYEAELGIGNLMEYDGDTAHRAICNYLLNNPTLLSIHNLRTLELFKEEVEEAFAEFLNKSTYLELLPEYLEDETLIPDEWISMVMNYNYKLLGGSEYYYSRVCDNVEMYYYPDDVVAMLVD